MINLTVASSWSLQSRYHFESTILRPLISMPQLLCFGSSQTSRWAVVVSFSPLTSPFWTIVWLVWNFVLKKRDIHLRITLTGHSEAFVLRCRETPNSASNIFGNASQVRRTLWVRKFEVVNGKKIGIHTAQMKVCGERITSRGSGRKRKSFADGFSVSKWRA